MSPENRRRFHLRVTLTRCSLNRVIRDSGVRVLCRILHARVSRARKYTYVHARTRLMSRGLFKRDIIQCLFSRPSKQRRGFRVSYFAINFSFIKRKAGDRDAKRKGTIIKTCSRNCEVNFVPAESTYGR